MPESASLFMAFMTVPTSGPSLPKRAVCHRADRAVLAARRARVMDLLEGGVMLLAAAPERPRTADILYPYRQDSDFDYLTGFPEPDAVAVLAPGAPERFVLFVRSRDPEREVWIGTRAGVEGAVEQYGADAAFPLD